MAILNNGRDEFGNLFSVDYNWVVKKSVSDLHEIANIIRNSLVKFENRENIAIETVATDDNRSYQINSDKIFKVLGYKPTRTLENAVYDLCNAFKSGKLPNSLSDDKYMNVRVMKNKNVL